MSFLCKTWELAGGNVKVTSSLREAVRGELLSLVSCCFLLHCNLGAVISPHMVATDASELGGAVGFSTELTDVGRGFVQAMRTIERSPVSQVIPVLIVSLFNGAGGAFRSYDILGVEPMGRIAVELDEGANRVTSRRLPATIKLKDVRSISRSDVRGWSLKFLRVKEVHIWAGFPCVDLSSVKHITG